MAQVDSCEFFFPSLQCLLEGDDVIGIGSYSMNQEIRNWLLINSIDIISEEIPYHHSFDFNRDEYPDGAAYPVYSSYCNLIKLDEFSKMPMGGVERDSFCDHIVAFRLGIPTIPLLNFHDAFMGGELFLTGFYSPKTVKKFSEAIGIEFEQIVNPEFFA